VEISQVPSPGERKDMFQVSDKIDELINSLDVDEVQELADSSCTNGYDNDGATGFDIFENGFQLAQKAGDRPVYVSHVRDERTALFFIGTEEEILRKISKLS
jgi:hypothetical protein